MSFMMVHGHCVSCGAHIAYNPNYVPSIRVEGEKQAVCRACFDRWNDIHRVSKGLEPLPIHPEAYEPEEVNF